MRSAKIAGMIVAASIAVAPSFHPGSSPSALGQDATAPRLTAGWHTENFPGAMQTYVYGISPTGELFGEYRSPSGTLHGFTDTGGIWITVDDPLAEPGGQSLTVGKLTSGAVIGSCELSDGTWFGFIDTSGTYRQISDPKALTGSGRGTVIAGVNAAGEMVGYYSVAGGARGFTYLSDSFKTVTYAGKSGLKVFVTHPVGISTKGSIVGYATTSSGYKGWELTSGHFKSLVDPKQPKGGVTTPIGIAPTSGEIVGEWWKSTKSVTPYGFRSVGGKYFGVSDPLGVNGTEPEAVNDGGIIAGFFYGASKLAQGFVWVP
jgi:hypothetical protein